MLEKGVVDREKEKSKNEPCDCSLKLEEFLWTPGFQFSGGSDGKESACNAGGSGSALGWRRSPGEGNGYPLKRSCLENPMDRGARWLQSIWSQRVRHNWAIKASLSQIDIEIDMEINVCVCVYTVSVHLERLVAATPHQQWAHAMPRSWSLKEPDQSSFGEVGNCRTWPGGRVLSFCIRRKKMLKDKDMSKGHRSQLGGASKWIQ